ncbi:Hypothetical predicted protein [Olea europaea subsp. europaea]|uniref:Uncharacterized protein n=1 Tax=Olea europaea subsp. europaea TaxID=158383 RepID=A0A8S0UXV4_OLEEU|nr:Hypothetical predicted protein [Olea europaea subsp. europaea]
MVSKSSIVKATCLVLIAAALVVSLAEASTSSKEWQGSGDGQCSSGHLLWQSYWPPWKMLQQYLKGR